MSRTFLLFLGVGALGWACWYLAMNVSEVSKSATPLLLGLSLVLPAVAAGVWWQRNSQPYRAAVGGLFASGALSFTYWFWFLVATPSLDDFEARTVGSQWELTLVLFVVICAIWALCAGAGAAVGSRLRAL